MTEGRSAGQAPKGPRVITDALIRDALACISPDVDRDTWARLGMAIKSERGSNAGFDLWNEWSARGESYDEGAARSTWRSIKAGGKTTIGTLFGIAKDHGFRFPDDDDGAAVQTPAPAAADLAERKRKREAEESQYRERADEAARVAGRMWAQGSSEVPSPYLARKGVQAYGVRCLADGTLLVPMRSAAGELQNLQRIAPTMPADSKTPEKRFLAGGRKTGLMHWCGDGAGAAVLLLCEGYATGASLHEATGRPVAVAFDAGNLVHVAKELRAAHPAALIVVCGDDDQATQARSGKNPGREKGASAARAARTDAAGALAVFPQGLAAGASDFNDMHVEQGLEEVRQLVEAAIAAAAVHLPASTSSEAAEDVPDDSVKLPHGFGFRDGWLWFSERDVDGGGGGGVKVCTWLVVEALTVDTDGGNAGRLVRFHGVRGEDRTWVMPARMLAGDGSEYRSALLSMGLLIAPGKRARDLLTLYLQVARPDAIVQCVERVGWHGRSFVLPRETLRADGTSGERIVFQSDGAIESPFRQRGTAQAWRDKVAALCVGNSRLLFGVSCAFAGTLLRPAGIESGGWNLVGNSADGKTTAQHVAGSVWGGLAYLQPWRSTDNALESVVAQHCDGFLALNELAQVEAKSAGECAYMLANEQGKSRSTRQGGIRPRQTWKVLFLSSGEISLAAHMSEGGKRARTGQEIRMADIPADAGAGCGIFETTHGHAGGSAFAQALTRGVEVAHGTAGRLWLEWAVANADQLRVMVRSRIEQLCDAWVPEGAHGQVHRVGQRFALVAAAGELATEAGLTGWSKGEATRGVNKCFNDWLALRAGGAGNSEEAHMLHQVRKWFALNGAGRLAWWHRALNDHAPSTGLRAGFKRLLDDKGKPVNNDSDHMVAFGEKMTSRDADDAELEYFVFPEVFESEICEGFNKRAVLTLLRDGGHLVIDKGRFFDCTARLPGMGPTRCYRIKASVSRGD